MKYPEFFTPFVFPENIPLLGAIRWYGLMYIVGIAVSCLILNHLEKKGWIKFKKKAGLNLTTQKKAVLMIWFFMPLLVL